MTNSPFFTAMKMFVVRNRWLPFKGFAAINLFGVLVCRKDTTLTDDLIRHERIHTAQMVEMLIVGFYVWYVVEWLVRVLLPGRAYGNIAFEREAYRHMSEEDYLSRRPHYAWVRYLKS